MNQRGILKEIMNIPWEALTALLLYIIASTIGFVWWMATQTITLQFVREDLQNANKLLGALESLSVTKPEFAKEVARFELSIQAAHRRIDEIKNKHGG